MYLEFLNHIKRLSVFTGAATACVFASSEPSLAQIFGIGEPEKIVIERTGDSAKPDAPTDNPLAKALKDVRGFKYKEDLVAFYQAREYEPYWTCDGDDYELCDHAEDFVEIIRASWTHGLNPFSYHLTEIEELSADGEGDIRLELLLSDAYVAYGQDMSGIRIDPRGLKSNKRFWQQPIVPQSLLALLTSDDIEKIVKSFTPRGTTYNRLREELQALVAQKPEAYEAILPIKIDGLLRPYNEHRAVRDLRLRFGLEDISGQQAFVYDDAVAAAVMKFQRENGLKDDAVIGPSTLEALNRSRMDKIHQIIANLERLRWIEEKKPEKFVIVNIPSTTLWAVDNGRVQFEMPVIVGRKKRPTNVFVTEITGVRLNPTWTVPPTIKREDIAPKLAEDPFYLLNKGIELTSGTGEEQISVDPSSIDWANVTDEELKTLSMVQTPGTHNPLGSVRVLMPNGYNIYLHDTNEKYLFDRSARAVSSGCVRMEEPKKMADFILEEKKGWTRERTEEILAEQKMKDLFIQKLIPVYLVYYTAWIDSAGRLVYGNDLYDYDTETIKMLSNIDGFFIPVDNNGNSMGVVAKNVH